MPMRAWFARSEVLPGAPGLRTLVVSAEQWRQAAQDLAAGGARLLSLWASRDEAGTPWMRVAFLAEGGGLVLNLPLTAPEQVYPGLEDLFPVAARLQRAIADLSGVRSTAADQRPWLRHAAWSPDRPPLGPQRQDQRPPIAPGPQGHEPPADAPPAQAATPAPARAATWTSAPGEALTPPLDDYPFVRVAGEGVHEIPVGPVHAGIIEPGHFRFSVVGEKVLRLEERLGYAHKGIEQRFTQLPLLQGQRLAARVSGDSAVAYSWAYCQALEGAAGVSVPPRAAWLRALCLELERIANHLGDLGALGNDAGFAFGLMQFSGLKERLLRVTEAALGARYLMDAVVPGGTGPDLSGSGAELLAGCLGGIAGEVQLLRGIYDEHEGLRDRFTGAGTVTPQLAVRLGLTGLAGRASGQGFDLRCDLPCEPYTQLAPRMIVRGEGDVAARVAVRFDELQESCRLVQQILMQLPGGSHLTAVRAPGAGAQGVGLIEGWRGPVLLALEAGPAGAIRRCHPHDPSWQNWPALEHAIIGNIVPDFPLINKSFNLSYSGHDL